MIDYSMFEEDKYQETWQETAARKAKQFKEYKMTQRTITIGYKDGIPTVTNFDSNTDLSGWIIEDANEENIVERAKRSIQKTMDKLNKELDIPF